MGKNAKKPEISPKRQRFVEEYLKDFNGKQAAIRAGYAAGSAEVQASRLLSDDKVKKAVDDARKEMSDTAIADAVELRRFWTEMVRNGERSADRLKASELLGKAHGIFVEKREVTGKDGTPLFDGSDLRRMALEIASKD